MTFAHGVYGQTVIIGTLFTQPDIDPETGEPVTAPVALDGWHANVPRPVPDALQAYELTPANPQMIYAGDAAGTAFLRFDNEAQGLAALVAAGMISANEEGSA